MLDTIHQIQRESIETKKLLDRKRLITPDVIKGIRLKMQLSPPEFGRLFGVKEGTVKRWELGTAFPSVAHCRKILEMLALEPQNRVMRLRICRQCGVGFLGGPHAWYCPDCRIQRQREAELRHKKNGTKRPLGSIDTCQRCGKEYVVTGVNQKYCPECAYEAVREVDRVASRAWNQAHKDTYYPAKNANRRAGPKKCVVCGKMFLPNGSPTICCSDECRSERKKQRQRKADQKRSQIKKERKTDQPK